MTTTQVVAYTPSELAVAQKTVRSWCAENIRRLLMQKREADANYNQARRGHFNSKPFKAHVRRCERRIEYYLKIGRAIKLGYMIVPNFDLDLFAVRTGQRKPRKTISTYKWEAFEQTGQVLPAGKGRYVDPVPVSGGYGTKIKSNGEEQDTYWPTSFDEEITFPVNIIKPYVIKETQLALDRKLFDQVGTAMGRRLNRSDPIVCGRILDPVRMEKAVTFFIAWWLDQDDI